VRLPLHDGFHCWIKRPAPAVWLVASCSIAIAAAAAVLAVAQATLWTPLPVTDPDALVRVWNDRHATDGFITPEEFVEWKRRQDVFDGLASYQPDHDVLLEIDNRLERLEALHVTTDLYDVLGVAPVAGRLFGPADAPSAAPEVAILSERAWRQLLNADPAIIGRRIALRTDAAPQPATVVGIVPDALDFRAWDGRRVDLYRPITDGIAAEGFGTYRVGNRYVIGRLRAGAERESAQRRFSVVAAEIARDVRVRRAGETRLRFEQLHDAFYGANRPFVRLLLVAALLVLAVAFTNAAGVAFALAGRRRREQAVRAALGADRVHLLKLHAREACVLGLCVVATTAVISQVFLGVLVALAPPELRRVEASAVGWQESAAMLGLVTAVIVVVTAAQAAGALRRPLSLSLQGAALATMSRSSLKLRQLIVAAQQAVVLALTVAGVLTAVSFWNLSSRPLGFVPENVVSIELELPRHLRASPERFLAFLDDVRREAYAAPRRRRVAFAFDTPLSHRYGFASVGVSGSPSVATVDNRVTDGFFGVLDIAILAGRDFRRSDYGQPVVVVNQQFARRYLGGTGRALGQSITVGGRTRPHEVIAVV
jgi:predicted permease